MPLSKLLEMGAERLDLLVHNSPEKQIHISELQQYIAASDVLNFQAPGSWDVAKLMDFAMYTGKKVMIDYDDFSFDLDPANPRYGQLGTKEVEIRNEKGEKVVQWRDMENEFDLTSNIDRYQAFLHMVSAVDMITTTTEYLASKFKSINPNVRILPNSIDFDLFRPLPRPEEYKDQIRIGWFGGDSHYVDLKIIKNVLKRLVDKYPQVKITLLIPQVPYWNEIFEGIDPKRVDYHGWAELSVYPLFLANRHFDIGLIPLADNDFNRCKSNLKWLEFSALKVPTVSQNMIPYSNSITDGRDGLLANTEEEWFQKVSELIEKPELRKNISENAYNKVKRDYNLDTNCRLWERAFIDCHENKPIPKLDCKCKYCKK